MSATLADIKGMYDSTTEGDIEIAGLFETVSRMIYWDGQWDIGDIFEVLRDNTGAWDAGLIPVMDLGVQLMEKMAAVYGPASQLAGQAGSMDSHQLAIAIGAVSKMFFWDGYWDMGDLFETLKNVKLDSSALTTLDTANEALGKIQTFAATMQMMVAATGSDGNLAATVSQIIFQVNESIAALNSMGELDVAAALDNFASAVAIGKESVTIDNQPVVITINMSVTMDANKVGKVLVDKSIMTAPLASAGGG